MPTGVSKSIIYIYVFAVNSKRVRKGGWSGYIMGNLVEVIIGGNSRGCLIYGMYIFVYACINVRVIVEHRIINEGDYVRVFQYAIGNFISIERVKKYIIYSVYLRATNNSLC